jgi:acetolactate synthase I/II/III large subunit
VSGDGSILYHIGELETALRCNILAVVVVLNNSCLASEYHTEKRLKGGRVVSEVLDFNDTDFAAIAKTFGAHGTRVHDSKDLKDAVSNALGLKHDCPG